MERQAKRSKLPAYWHPPTPRRFKGMQSNLEDSGDAAQARQTARPMPVASTDEREVTTSPDLGCLKTILMHIVKHGLNPAKGKPTVVVVGAGISGLTSARELLRVGYDVKILEKTSRAGGRIFSLREPFSDGLWAEAGAMRIPPVHYLVHAYQDVLGLEMDTFQNALKDKMLYLDEPGIPRKLVHLNDAAEVEDLLDYWSDKYKDHVDNEGKLSPIALPIADPRKPDEKLKIETTVYNLQEEIEEMGYPAAIAKYDHLTYRQFLKEKDWTEDEIQLYAEVEGLEVLMEAGAPEVFAEDVAQLWDDKAEYPHPITRKPIVGLHEFTGGMDKLVAGFMDSSDFADGKIRDHVTYGAEVTHYDTKPGDDGKVAVTYMNTSTGQETTLKCDYVVSAVPNLVMRNITASPPFSFDKQKSIREASYGTAGKIMLQYSKQWWLDDFEDAHNGGAGLATTMPIRTIYYPPAKHSEYAKTKKGVIIASYVWQQDAMVWGAMSEQEMVKKAVAQVDKIHPGTAAMFEVGGAVMWHEQDQTGGGAFAFFQPGDWTRLFYDMVKPDGVPGDERFVFCGEHISAAHGWIQGAMDSALWSSFQISEMNRERHRDPIA